MSDAIALDAPHSVSDDRLEVIAAGALIAIAGTVQFSIAAAQILLTVTVACWVGLLLVRRERFEAPAFFWPLVIYAAATLVSDAFSFDPRTSLISSKQLVIFLLVPLTYRLATAQRASTLMTVVLSCAAISAVIGVVQYGILHYDVLQQRPQGTLGHYMTYSGLLMIVLAIAVARVLFGKGGRMWAGLVIPALAVAIALTLTRGAWVGVCVAAALLFALKDFRLFAILPIVAAIFFAIAPGLVMQRFNSIFDKKDPSSMDRVAMLHVGERMIEAHPLAGVGKNMVQPLYAQYRGPDAVNKINPHLHNNFLQIAAERGLPALAIWIWFIVALARDLWTRFRFGEQRFFAAAGLATLAALLTGGLFEYNFGDSEVLMLFLIITTLPAAAARSVKSQG